MSKFISITFIDKNNNDESFKTYVKLDKLEKIEYLHNTYKFNNNPDELTIELSRHNALFNEEIFEFILLYCTTTHTIDIVKLSDLLNTLLYLDYFSIINIDIGRFSIHNDNKFETLNYLILNKEYLIYAQIYEKWHNENRAHQLNKMIIDGEIKELYKCIIGNYFYDESMEKPIVMADCSNAKYYCLKLSYGSGKDVGNVLCYSLSIYNNIPKYDYIYIKSRYENKPKKIYFTYHTSTIYFLYPSAVECVLVLFKTD